MPPTRPPASTSEIAVARNSGARDVRGGEAVVLAVGVVDAPHQRAEAQQPEALQPDRAGADQRARRCPRTCRVVRPRLPADPLHVQRSRHRGDARRPSTQHVTGSVARPAYAARAPAPPAPLIAISVELLVNSIAWHAASSADVAPNVLFIYTVSACTASDSRKTQLHLRGARSFMQGRFETLGARAVRRRLDAGRAEASLALKTQVTIERARSHHLAQRLARRRLRPVDQSLPRLRAWLHLLLRPAEPCLPRALARPRLRDQALRQDQRGRAAARGARQARLPAAARSRSAPTPTATSRSSASTRSRARSSRCWPSASTRSPSSPSRRWSSATSTCSARWRRRISSRCSSRSARSTASSRASSSRARRARSGASTFSRICRSTACPAA